MTLSEERLREMLVGLEGRSGTEHQFDKKVLIAPDTLRAVLTELLSLRSDAHTSGEVTRYSPKLGRVDGYMFRTFDGMEPDLKGEWVKFAELPALGHPIQGEAPTGWVMVRRDVAELLADNNKRYTSEWWSGFNTFREMLIPSPQPPTPAGVREITWQTMDSAPLDGKHCILAVKEGAFVYSIQGAYDGKHWNVVHRDNVQPLYWMPNKLLPEGWEAAAKGAGE